MKKLLSLIILVSLMLTACTDGGEDSSEPLKTEAGGVTTGAATTAEQKEVPVMSAPAVYPSPRSFSFEKWLSCDGISLTAPEDFITVGEKLLYSAGISKGSFPVRITYSDIGAESYSAVCSETGAEIKATDSTAAFYAMQTLISCTAVSDGKIYIAAVKINDSPDMPMRGVIEGFYGEPWTDAERTALFEFFGKNKMNTYIYAPKDDAKHRARWRDKYTAKEITRMQTLINAAHDNFVNFVYAISPGLDIDLEGGYDKDFTALCEKCEQLYSLGVRDFAIFLDDISNKSPQGHAKLLNDFQAKFIETHDGCRDLICITTEFCDAMITSAYTPKIADALDDDIVVMWTGEGVVPASIGAESLSRAVKTFGRRLFIWWNYPVNDTMATHLFLDGCTGLKNDIAGSVLGVASNPMNQPVCSRIALFTIADFLWNTKAYDNTASLKASFADFTANEDEARALAVFADAISGNTTNGFSESVKLKTLIKDAEDGRDGAKEKLLAVFAEMESSADILLASENKEFIAEAREWLLKFKAYGTMGRTLATLLSETDMPKLMALAGEYSEANASISSNQSSVSSTVLAPYFLTAAKRAATSLSLNKNEAIPAVLKTNLPVYMSYTPENACDGDDSTFFWSAGAVSKDLYVMLDLGKPEAIRRIRILSGVEGHPEDHIEHGRLEYSSDNKNWVVIGEYTQRELDIKDIDISARYIRYISTTNQTYWLTLADFSAYGDDCTERVTLSGEGDASALCDGNIFTSANLKKGDIITCRTEGGSRLRLFAYSGKADISAVVNGETVKLCTLDGEFCEATLQSGTSSVVMEILSDCTIVEADIQ